MSGPRATLQSQGQIAGMLDRFFDRRDLRLESSRSRRVGDVFQQQAHLLGGKVKQQDRAIDTFPRDRLPA